MSGAKAVKPRPGRLLMGLPPDTRVVIADVTWNDYAPVVEGVAEGANCRVSYDGKDVELMNVGPVHDSCSEILVTWKQELREWVRNELGPRTAL